MQTEGAETADSGWRWEDGNNLIYKAWNGGEPNNGMQPDGEEGQEDCLEWAHTWNDNDCSVKNIFACEISGKKITGLDKCCTVLKQYKI